MLTVLLALIFALGLGLWAFSSDATLIRIGQFIAVACPVVWAVAQLV